MSKTLYQKIWDSHLAKKNGKKVRFLLPTLSNIPFSEKRKGKFFTPIGTLISTPFGNFM